MTQQETPTQQTAQEHPHDNPMPLLSMIFGIVSFTGFGILLSVPAIVLAAISLKHRLPNRGFSIAGLVTGIVSTAISVVFGIFSVVMIIWAVNHPQDFSTPPHNDYNIPSQSDQPFGTSRT